MHNLAKYYIFKTRRNKLDFFCRGMYMYPFKMYFLNLIFSCLYFFPQFLRFNICLRKETDSRFFFLFIFTFSPVFFKTIQKLCRLEISTNKRINDFSFIFLPLFCFIKIYKFLLYLLFVWRSIMGEFFFCWLKNKIEWFLTIWMIFIRFKKYL